MLLELGLISQASDVAISALCKIYRVQQGSGDDVHYREFLLDLERAVDAIHAEYVNSVDAPPGDDDNQQGAVDVLATATPPVEVK